MRGKKRGPRINLQPIANKKENFMAKKTSANMGVYLVRPEVKSGVVWPSIPKDAKSSESQYAYFARKYMAAQAARTKKGPPLDDLSRITSSPFKEVVTVLLHLNPKPHQMKGC